MTVHVNTLWRLQAESWNYQHFYELWPYKRSTDTPAPRNTFIIQISLISFSLLIFMQKYKEKNEKINHFHNKTNKIYWRIRYKYTRCFFIFIN